MNWGAEERFLSYQSTDIHIVIIIVVFFFVVVKKQSISHFCNSTRNGCRLRLREKSYKHGLADKIFIVRSIIVAIITRCESQRKKSSLITAGGTACSVPLYLSSQHTVGQVRLIYINVVSYGILMWSISRDIITRSSIVATKFNSFT